MPAHSIHADHKCKNYFKASWLTEPQLRDWLRRDPNDEYSYKCIICNVTKSCASMGIIALEQHMNSRKHQWQYVKYIEGRLN